MPKKITFMLIMALIFSITKVEAAALYDGDDKTFVETFNKAAEKFGNVKLNNFLFINNVGNFDIFVANFEGMSKDSGISIIKDGNKKIIEIFVVTDAQDKTKKFFEAVRVTLGMPEISYRESLKSILLKTSSNKYVKVSASVLEVKKQKIYTLSFKL